jgi:hypothetical protein
VSLWKFTSWCPLWAWTLFIYTHSRSEKGTKFLPTQISCPFLGNNLGYSLDDEPWKKLYPPSITGHSNHADNSGHVNEYSHMIPNNHTNQIQLLRDDFVMGHNSRRSFRICREGTQGAGWDCSSTRGIPSRDVSTVCSTTLSDRNRRGALLEDSVRLHTTPNLI